MKKLLCVVCVSAIMLIPVFAAAGAKEYEYTANKIYLLPQEITKFLLR